MIFLTLVAGLTAIGFLLWLGFVITVPLARKLGVFGKDVER